MTKTTFAEQCEMILFELHPVQAGHPCSVDDVNQFIDATRKVLELMIELEAKASAVANLASLLGLEDEGSET